MPLGSLIWDDNKTIENKKRQTHFEKYRVENINFKKNLGNDIEVDTNQTRVVLETREPTFETNEGIEGLY